jgi:hypothetical protein
MFTLRCRGCLLPAILAVLCALTLGRAAELPPMLPSPASFSTSKPGQLALSPEGDRVAVADRFANRVYVFDVYGKVIWSAGEGVTLAQPTAVLWLNNKELMFSLWDSRVLLRVAEDEPQRIDTAAELSAALGEKGRVLRLYPRRDSTCLALTESPDGLRHFDRSGRLLGVLIKGGSGRGCIGRTSTCALLSSGRLVVVGNPGAPVQIFDADGKALIVADWNRPAAQNTWTATATAVDARGQIWVADATYAQFRTYDQSGTLLDTRPFAVKTSRPVDMLVTSDNHLVVVDASGRLDLYALGEER